MPWKRRYLLNYLNRIWDFFKSVKLTIVLLLSLAATSIIGTLIPQNESPENYRQAFGEFLYRIFDIFDFFDMYHSWWFLALLFLLTLNIVVCSIDRLSNIWKIIFVKNPRFNPARFRNRRDKEEFSEERSIEQLKRAYEPVVSRGFGYSRLEETEDGFYLVAEKGRWTRLGVYTVHLSVILLLLGAIIGSLFGFDGYVNIPEGETVNSIRLRNSNKTMPLPFEIRCDDFDVSFYKSGAPREFRSSLTILNHSRPVLQKDIIVNDPLRYQGISLYQASYGRLPPNEITLNLSSKKTGKIYQEPAVLGQPVEIPEGLGTLTLKAFRESADFQGTQIGPAFIGNLTDGGGKSVFILLPLKFPSFDKMRKGDLIIGIAAIKDRYYTGLQVARDPGVRVVYAGFILMLIGCYITFFMSHQQLCIEVTDKGSQRRVMVAGTANKNKPAMQRRVKKLSEKLAET